MPKITQAFTHRHPDGRVESFYPGDDVPEGLENDWHVKAHTDDPPPLSFSPGNMAYYQAEQDKRRRYDLLTQAGDQDALAERAQLLSGQHRAYAEAVGGTHAVVGSRQAPMDGSPNLALGKSASEPGLGRGDVAPKDEGDLTSNVERAAGQDAARNKSGPLPEGDKPQPKANAGEGVIKPIETPKPSTDPAAAQQKPPMVGTAAGEQPKPPAPPAEQPKPAAPPPPAPAAAAAPAKPAGG